MHRQLVLEKVRELTVHWDKEVAIIIPIILLKLEVFEVYVDSYSDLKVYQASTKPSWVKSMALQWFYS